MELYGRGLAGLGKAIKFSAESIGKGNPLHVPEVVLDKDGFIAEKVEFDNAIVEQAIKPAPCTSRHTAIIDKALRELYIDFFEKRAKLKGKKKVSLDSPTLKIMRDYIAENFDMENNEVNEIVSYLESYTDGTMSIFSHQQSVAEKNRLTVYGFADLGSKMRSMAMLIMMETITSQIKYNQADGVSTWVYADEVHEIWGDEFALKSINRMWREVRKRGGICTGMSQNIIDAKQCYKVNCFKLRIYFTS